MAKNYSRGTLDCLVWDRLDSSPPASPGLSNAPSIIKKLDGRQKKTPHRPETLNETHFNTVGIQSYTSSQGAPGWEATPLRKGRRTINTMVREDDAEAEVRKDGPSWKKRVALGHFFQGGDPGREPASHKKGLLLWDWQNREFNLSHADENSKPPVQHVLCAKRSNQRQARKELTKHLSSVSRFKAVNRLQSRGVTTAPDRYCPTPPRTNVTKARSPVFTARVTRDKLACYEARGTEVESTQGGHYHLPPRVPVSFYVPTRKDMKERRRMAKQDAASSSPPRSLATMDPAAAPPRDGPAPEVYGTVEQVRHVLMHTARPAAPQSARTRGVQLPQSSKAEAKQRPLSCRVREKIDLLANKFLESGDN